MQNLMRLPLYMSTNVIYCYSRMRFQLPLALLSFVTKIHIENLCTHIVSLQDIYNVYNDSSHTSYLIIVEHIYMLIEYI
jgi:hypothetical protein